VSNYLPSLVAATVVPALTVVTLAFVDVWSALIVVFTLPLMPLFAALIGRHTQDETDRRWAALTRLAGHFLDVVQGLPTLVVYGRARHQIRVVAEVGERHRRATMRTLRTAFMSTAALELLATISGAMVAVAVGLRLRSGGWTCPSPWPPSCWRRKPTGRSARWAPSFIMPPMGRLPSRRCPTTLLHIRIRPARLTHQSHPVLHGATASMRSRSADCGTPIPAGSRSSAAWNWRRPPALG